MDSNSGHLQFPREIAPGVYWLGGCLSIPHNGRQVHSHNSCYIVQGEQHAILIDTGYPDDWPSIECQLETVLGNQPLDFVLPTHPEIPHSGNIPRLIEKYPQIQVIGDLRGYSLLYPEHTEYFFSKKAGDSIELGGTRIIFVNAVLHDLPNTLWAYDTGSKVLFSSDGLSFSHGHAVGECVLFTTELASYPGIEEVSFFSERAFYWSQFVDARTYFRELRKLLTTYPAKMIAGCHSNVIVNPEQIIPYIEKGMVASWRGASDR